MSPFNAEIAGTAILIVLGDGVVANVILNKTKGFNGGLVSITLGWSMAVFVGVFVSAASSGAHLNPAVTIALAYAGKFEWALVPQYLAAQMIGAMIGAFLVWLAYKQHFDETPDGDTKLGVFCTAPAKRNSMHNFLTELIGTFVFMFAVLSLTSSSSSLGSLAALPVALVVLAIGLSLVLIHIVGIPVTGVSVNPARSIGPAIFVGGTAISQLWLFIIAPVLGSIIAAFIWRYFVESSDNIKA